MSWFRRPTWFAGLLTLAAALLFVRLGVWQLDRANEKEAWLRRYAAAMAGPLRDFTALPPLTAASLPARVTVHGVYRANRVYLLDNPHHDERGGAEVYVPLQRDAQGPWLLVDLGFLPGSGDGKIPEPPALATGQIQLEGLYQPLPGHGFEMGGNALARQAHWPKSTVYLDLAQIQADLQHPLNAWILALDADPAAPYLRVHQIDFAEMPPARHRAYAFQWFTFALAAVVIFLVLHRRRLPSAQDAHESIE